MFLRVFLRFLVVTLLAATLISLFGRIFSDFDEPPESDPYDLIRGLGVWLAAVMIAVLNEMQLRRRQKSSDPSDPLW